MATWAGASAARANGPIAKTGGAKNPENERFFATGRKPLNIKEILVRDVLFKFIPFCP